jgi:hypothetical protein
MKERDTQLDVKAAAATPERKLPYRRPELTVLALSQTLGGDRRRDKENPVFFPFVPS